MNDQTRATATDHPPDAPAAAATADEATQARINRRRFLLTGAASGVAATAGGFSAAGIAGAQDSASATPPATGEQPAATAGGFVHFVPFQAAIVEAAAARLIPSDDLGPGATEAGVVTFIDRQLYGERTGSFGYRGQRYDSGPYLPGEATQGDQSALPMTERFRLGIYGMEEYARQVYGRGFVQLAPEEQDRVLSDMENGVPETFGGASIVSSPAVPAPNGGEAIEQAAQAQVGAKAFFDLLLTYTVAGFFADPVHGGNREMVGWKLIGFPGAQMGYGDWILRYGEPFDGPTLSIADHQQAVTGGA